MAAHPQLDLDVSDSGGTTRYTLVAGTRPEANGSVGQTHLSLVVDTPAVAAPSVARPERDRFDRLRRHCPRCGRLGIRIVYGELRGALVEAVAQGRIVRGGSIYRAATHRCPMAHEWDSTEKPPLS